MADSIIFNSPFILVCFCLALFFCVYDLIKHSSGYIFPLISIVIAVLTIIYSLLIGAAMQEILIMVLIFFVINMTAFVRKGESK